MSERASEPSELSAGRPAGVTDRIEITAVRGLPDFRPGDDLAAAIAAATPWLADGDIVVVTSKAVSKVEGRLVSAPGGAAAREAARQRAIGEESVATVASRGRMRIVENRQGFVMTAAGVDTSNVRADEIALLPLDPDHSAQLLRDDLKRLLGVDVAVVVTDTSGRVWRAGLVDLAVGVAGMGSIWDLRGMTDTHGHELTVTETATADEIAAAADLVKGKLAGVPVAVVRGLAAADLPVDDGRGARALLRPRETDLFRLGTAEALAQGRREATGITTTEHTRRLHADAEWAVRTFEPPTPEQADLATAMAGYLAARPDAADRRCELGHVTASTVLLDAVRQHVLLTLHPRVGRWLQLGGHLEDADASIAAAALREATEESGIPGLTLDPQPISLGVHPITCSIGVPTRHFDIRYLAVASAGATPAISTESLQLGWFPVDRLPEPIAADVGAMVALALARSGQ